MKLSIHYTQGKSTAPDALQEMGRNWVNIDVSWQEAFELITKDGYASSAELLSDHRIGKDFVSRQLLMIDVDSGMTIQQLLEHPFYNAYGAGFYATHSFKPDNHRFRICFVLEQAETNHTRCRSIIRGLLEIFPAGDVACKDPVRLFYGNPNCEIKERTDNVLPNEIIDALVSAIETKDAEAVKSAYTGPSVINDAQKRKILELLKQTFVGEYRQWRDIGWGLKAGGFSLQDFQYVTAGLMRLKSDKDAANCWNDGKQVAGGIGMGTVILFLQEHYGKDCLRETRTTRQVGKLFKAAETAAQKWLKD